ncbi:MAG: hypothetical protein H5T97_07115 [Firmicutes bacterium]|nr:hypothetical protein [Bacillota bacterium]
MGRVNPREVRKWLKGQELAARRIERERRAWLANLDAETALRLYLDLLASEPAGKDPERPSSLLLAMRRALARRGRGGT